jgi:DNA-binding response OmpR family regulator
MALAGSNDQDGAGGRPARILLVDDEQPVQKLLSFPLEKEGYEVVAALDGQEALKRFENERFDLVVLDIMLPKMDGLEVCRRMRAKSSVPIIMLTAKAEEIDKVLGLEIGADDYITKPFSMREFRAVCGPHCAGPRWDSSTRTTSHSIAATSTSTWRSAPPS